MERQRTARWTGIAILGVMALGIAAAIFVSRGININLDVDAQKIIGEMASAGGRLYGKAWITIGLGLIDLLIASGLFLLLREQGRFLALWSLVVGIAGTVLVLAGGLETMKIAVLLNSEGLRPAAPDALFELQTAFLAGDYAAFHLGLVVNAIAKAGFFFLFLRSGLVPPLIAGWGLFASLFVAGAVVGRDFVDVLGAPPVTMGFMASNLLAHLALGLYLVIRGVREKR